MPANVFSLASGDAGGRRTGLRKAAATPAWLAGLGFGIPGVYGIFYFAKHGSVATVMGFPTYGDGPFGGFGINTSVPLLGAFVGVCALECVDGWLLWTGRRSGQALSWALLPAESVFWIGFALPFGPPLGLLRAVLAHRLAAERSQPGVRSL
jgi:hypothetical protein